MRARLIILFLMLFLSASISRAAEYSLTIQPILSEDKTQEAYQPLADYLSSQTGQTITLITHRNFTFYWNKMRNQQQGSTWYWMPHTSPTTGSKNRDTRC